jgi:tRNA U54 and U55 pseudouridine synthase Pus10
MANNTLAASTNADAADVESSTISSSNQQHSSAKRNRKVPSTATNKVGKKKFSRVAETKADVVIKKLRSSKGATIDVLMEVTGWQAHSVRGFLSGTVKKRLGLSLSSEIGKDGIRRYRIYGNQAAA